MKFSKKLKSNHFIWLSFLNKIESQLQKPIQNKQCITESGPFVSVSCCYSSIKFMTLELVDFGQQLKPTLLNE